MDAVGNQATDDLVDAQIERQMSFLRERIDPDCGLLEILLEGGALSWKEISIIKSRSSSHERNSLLLDYILKNRAGNRLITSLQDADQVHISNYLIANAEYKTSYGGEWPLTEYEISILDTNRESVADLLNLDDLLDQLVSTKVINRRQLVSITSKLTSHEKAETMLEILRRSSLNNYKQTIGCLRCTKQNHIAELLENGGALVRVHVELSGDEVDQAEEEIITRFKTVMSRKPTEDTRQMFPIADIQIKAAKKGHGIVLYFHCKSVKDLVDLRDLQKYGQLKSVIERVFNQLLSPLQYSEVTAENLKSVIESVFTQLLYRSQIATLTVTLSEDEYEKCRAIFPGDIKMRAVFDLDPKLMSQREKQELRKIQQFLHIGGQVVKEQLYEIYNPDDEADLEAAVLSFKKGNKMQTIPPANIGDNIGWWMARHLESGQIGFVPRNRFVIDSSSEKQTAKTTVRR